MTFESTRGRGSAEVAAKEVAAELQDAGHQALFAGGCVRDRTLGLVAEDFDIATSATPDQVQTIYPRSRGVGEFFGVMLIYNHGWPIQVATFRTEGPYTDHRRPDHVAPATIEQDAARRDFTINGMYWDPIKEAAFDPYNGEQDLADGLIRAIGDPLARFDEDHLRMLRAVRFASRLSFRIDPATESAIKQRHDRLEGISRERIGEEVRRMLLNENRALAAELLEALGLAKSVLGNVAPGWSGPRHLESLPADLSRAAYAQALAAWALDRGQSDPPMELAGHWREQLMLSNGDRNGLAGVLEIHDRLLKSEWANLGVAGQKRLAAQPWFEAALSLLRVEEPETADEVSERVDTLRPSGLAPPRLLNGTTLIEAGLPPGPRFSEIIESVYDAQLEGRITTDVEALALAKEMWKKAVPND